MTNGEEGSQGAVESALVGWEAMLGCDEKLLVLRVLYCASVTFVRGRERERDACDVIDITLKSRVIMHMITSTVRRPNASTRSEPVNVERSNFEGLKCM